MDTLESLEQEAAKIHADIYKCQMKLTDIVRRRDAVVTAADEAKRVGGGQDTTLHVPTAKLKAPKGH